MSHTDPYSDGQAHNAGTAAPGDLTALSPFSLANLFDTLPEAVVVASAGGAATSVGTSIWGTEASLGLDRLWGVAAGFASALAGASDAVSGEASAGSVASFSMSASGDEQPKTGTARTRTRQSVQRGMEESPVGFVVSFAGQPRDRPSRLAEPRVSRRPDGRYNPSR